MKSQYMLHLEMRGREERRENREQGAGDREMPEDTSHRGGRIYYQHR